MRLAGPSHCCHLSTNARISVALDSPQTQTHLSAAISTHRMSQPGYHASTPPASSSRYATPPSSTQSHSQQPSGSYGPPPPITKRDSQPLTQTNRLSSIPGSLSIQHQLFGQSSAPQGILDKPLNRTKGAEISMAAWSFLFAEIISYCQSRVDSISDLEQK
jgi:hypothetical protein